MADSFTPDSHGDSFQPDPAPGFLETVGSDALSLLKAVRHPVQAAAQMANSSVEHGAQAIQGIKEGDARKVYDNAYQAVPGIGPMLWGIAQDLVAGNHGRAAARLAELAVPEVAGEYGPKITETLGKAADAVKDVMPSPTNPHLLKGAGGALGAAAGHATGIPGAGYVGGFMGREVGAALADKFNPPPVASSAVPIMAAPEIAPELEDMARANYKTSFDKLPGPVQDMLKKAAEKASVPQPSPTVAPQPAAAAPPAPEPAAEPPAPAPVATSVPQRPTILQEDGKPLMFSDTADLSTLSPSDRFNVLRDNLRAKLIQQGVFPKDHVWDAPNRAPRFDEGGPSETIKPVVTKILKSIDTNSPLAKNLKALEAATKLAAAMEK